MRHIQHNAVDYASSTEGKSIPEYLPPMTTKLDGQPNDVPVPSPLSSHLTTSSLEQQQGEHCLPATTTTTTMMLWVAIDPIPQTVTTTIERFRWRQVKPKAELNPQRQNYVHQEAMLRHQTR